MVGDAGGGIELHQAGVVAPALVVIGHQHIAAGDGVGIDGQHRVERAADRIHHHGAVGWRRPGPPHRVPGEQSRFEAGRSGAIGGGIGVVARRGIGQAERERVGIIVVAGPRKDVQHRAGTDGRTE